MDMEGGDYIERSRQTAAYIAGEPVPVPGKVGGAFRDHPVQSQSL